MMSLVGPQFIHFGPPQWIRSQDLLAVRSSSHGPGPDVLTLEVGEYTEALTKMSPVLFSQVTNTEAAAHKGKQVPHISPGGWLWV